MFIQLKFLTVQKSINHIHSKNINSLKMFIQLKFLTIQNPSILIHPKNTQLINFPKY